jgi:hypothetical protein
MRGSYPRHCFGSRRQCLAALIFHAVMVKRRNGKIFVAAVF